MLNVNSFVLQIRCCLVTDGTRLRDGIRQKRRVVYTLVSHLPPTFHLYSLRDLSIFPFYPPLFSPPIARVSSILIKIRKSIFDL